MGTGKRTSKREKRAMSVSLYGNLFFVVIELVMAIVTGSQAVLLDAVYDGIEFFMLLPSIFLIPLLIVLTLSLGLLGIQCAQPLADIATFLLALFVIRGIFKEFPEDVSSSAAQ